MRIRFNAVPDNIMREQLVMKKIEMIQLRKQIETFAAFLPDEVLKYNHSGVAQFVTVILWIDIRGTTRLTEKYNKFGQGGIYRLTATLNAFLGSIVEIIFAYGGDVTTISYSLIVSIWKVSPDVSLYEILHEVVMCALVIQKTMDNFNTEVNCTLKVTSSISCGNVTFNTFGTYNNKMAIIFGEAFNEVFKSNQRSDENVVVSASAWSHMQQENYETTKGAEGNIRIISIHYKPMDAFKKAAFDAKNIEVLSLVEIHMKNRELFHLNNRFDCSVLDTKLNESFAHSLPVRQSVKQAPRIWIVDELTAFILKPVREHVHESQPIEYLTEIRDITLQAILINTDALDPLDLIDVIDECFNMILKISSESLGVIKHIHMLDTQTEVIVMYGLRGIKHEMESQNVLRCSFRIQSELPKNPRVKCVSIGVATGVVYCSVLGHPMRREFLVIGTPVYRARRCMFNFPGKIMCDYRTFKFSRLASFYFKYLPTSRTGHNDVGFVFEYDENREYAFQQESELDCSLLGRSELLDYIYDIMMGNLSYRGICLIGLEKIGKSVILRTTLNAISSDFIIASIELEVNSKIPYFCITKLYEQIYNQCGMRDNLVSNFINLPRNMLDPNADSEMHRDDISLQKYRFLNYFRNAISVSKCLAPVIICVDNVDFIDLQSWEILELVLEDGNNLRYLFTGVFSEPSWDLRFKISLNEHITVVEIPPLPDNLVTQIACKLLRVDGIPRKLYNLLVLSCEGRPGYIQSCLLRLMNNGSIELQLISRESGNATMVYPNIDNITTDLVSVVRFSDKYGLRNDDITLAAISLDVFDSFPAYYQLVIKTASVLGNIFTRMLLVVALKYPPEATLAKVIKHLFDEEIFDCGARYICGGEIELVNKTCCRCYFEKGFFDDRVTDELPPYSFCKIIHFKNKSIREVTYNLLPGNQRTELHTLCTNILENTIHYCPNCIQNPSSVYLSWLKYQHVVDYCDNPTAPMPAPRFDEVDVTGLQDCVRHNILMQKRYRASHDEHMFMPVNPDPTRCYCLELMMRIYKDLMNHSEKAGHLGKLIFFTLQYGQLLICMRDHGTAIKILNESRELCLIDENVTTQISDVFRKLLLGKICMALAKATIDLRQLMAAKNHLAIALRQYNIPSLALSYKHFNKLLTRSFLVNSKHVMQRQYKNTMARCDMGLCLAHCARLFSLEGKWDIAKYASSFSIYLLKNISNHIPILLDVYCIAIDIYRHVNDMRTCEKLQRSFLKDFQMNYTFNSTYNIYGLTMIIATVFENHAMCGEISAAIRIGYRILDINCHFHMSPINYRVVLFLSYLLSISFRLKESVDVLRLILLRPSFVSEDRRQLAWHSACLSFHLYTGFHIIPIDKIIKYAYRTLKTKAVKYNWEQYYFVSMLQVHYARLGNHSDFHEWTFRVSFCSSNVRRDTSLWTLMACLECRITMLLHYREMKNPNVSLEEKVILNMLELFKVVTNTQMKLYQPNYLCFKAWWARINGHKWRASSILKKVIPICNKQNNVMQRCFTRKLMSYWKGGHTAAYGTRVVPYYEEAITYSELQWAQCLDPFPYF